MYIYIYTYIHRYIYIYIYEGTCLSPLYRYMEPYLDHGLGQLLISLSTQNGVLSSHKSSKHSYPNPLSYVL